MTGVSTTLVAEINKDEHIRQTRETPIRNQMYMNMMLQQNAMTA